MRTSGASRAATVVLAIEAVGLLALAGWQVVALTSGDTESAVSAVALIVLTVAGAAAVAAFAAATWRGASWGRSGGIVTQLLILAVALGAATGAYAHPLVGLALAVPAVVGFVLLVLAVRTAARERTAAERDEHAGPDADR
jgi:hypothetical protein